MPAPVSVEHPVPAIELFSYNGCPFAQRTHMVLLEKALDFELVEIDLRNRPDWFREISPHGKVPVLRHEGRVVHESAVINEYLDEAFPAHPLMPADAYGRAMARIWMLHCEARFLPALRELMAARDRPGALPPAREKLGEAMRFMEREGLRRAGDGPYWLGATPSLVDFHYLPFFERFAVYEELAGAEWPVDCSRLRAWYEAVGQRPSFLATRHTLDFHLSLQFRMDQRRAAASAPAAGQG